MPRDPDHSGGPAASGWTKTTCPYCGVGCGLLAKPGPDSLTAEIKGDPDHPANFGRLCSKELNPADLAELGLRSADLAVVKTGKGEVVLRVAATDRQPAGSVFVPMHWTDQLASQARIGALIPAHTDPFSGQPELKHTPVSVRPYRAPWYGFAVLPEQPDPGAFDYAAIAPSKSGWRLEFAGKTRAQPWDRLAAELLTPANGEPTELLSYQDNASRQFRFAAFSGSTCVGLLYIAGVPVPVSRTWAAEQLGAAVPADHRIRLLAGRPGADVPDRGAIICSCLYVGANQITTAISAHGCVSVDAVGQKTGAGTNCSSCRPEIERLIHDTAFAHAV